MLKIEEGKKYVMVRIGKMYIGIHAIWVVNQPDFSSPSTLLNYRVIGDNGLCFDDSPIHTVCLLANLCTHYEHWVTLAHGWALTDSRENALKYCRKALLWEYYRDEKLVPFRQNMPVYGVYGWDCSIDYRKVLAQLRELKL